MAWPSSASFLIILLTLAATKIGFGIPVYYINMDDLKDRARLMDEHLRELGFPDARRVSGLTAKTCNLLMLERSCKGHKGRMGFEEIGILCSHINAIRIAVEDESPAARKSKYALILEDDVRFSFSVDFSRLIEQAPRDFGVLQLMTSHRDDFEVLWEQFTGAANLSSEAHAHAHLHKGGDKEKTDKYNHRLWTFRDRQSTVWSAQAYVINKDIYRGFISAAVKRDRQGKLGFKIIAQQDFNKKNEIGNKYKPIVMSQCIFADMFIYSVGTPCYILNTPMFNGALVGHNSSYNLHQKHVAFHVRGFFEIYKAQQQLLAQSSLPSFASPLPSTAIKTAREGKAINWTQVLAIYPKPSWADGD
jgi:GR25 family glycosyltransferase involved in LPS biosynthesis